MIVKPSRQGHILLRPGRRYRLLLAVEGIIALGQLDAVLERVGFVGLGLTWPDDWPALAPADWPAEPPSRLTYPHGLVRGSGDLWCRGSAVRFEPETELGAGSFTLIRAWDVGEAASQGQAVDEYAEPDETGEFEVGADAAPGEMSTGVKVALASALGLGLWAFWSGRKEEERLDSAAARYASLAARADTARIMARARELEAEGMGSSDAQAVAELESVERADEQNALAHAMAAES